MKTYVVKSNRDVQVRNMLAFKGEVNVAQYDFRPWAEDNGVVVSLSAEVLSGQASLSVGSADAIVKNDTFTFNSSLEVIYGQDSYSSSYFAGMPIVVSGSSFNDGAYTISSISGNALYTVEDIPVLEIVAATVTGSYYDTVDLTITTAEYGASLIKLSATTVSGNVLVTHLRVVAKDPSVVGSYPTDYV